MILSTASPYKFPASVLAALGQSVPADEFEALRTLEEKSGMPAPESLRVLRGQTERFGKVISKEEIRQVALSL